MWSNLSRSPKLLRDFDHSILFFIFFTKIEAILKTWEKNDELKGKNDESSGESVFAINWMSKHIKMQIDMVAALGFGPTKKPQKK
jgi:hypothetical protein